VEVEGGWDWNVVACVLDSVDTSDSVATVAVRFRISRYCLDKMQFVCTTNQ
jgi:hypothetical protein